MSYRWFQVGGGCKIGAKTSVRLRQQREDGSWSDEGTAYQDELDSDVDVSDEEEDGADWGGADDDGNESWGATTPRSSRYHLTIVLLHSSSHLQSVLMIIDLSI